MLVLSRRRDEKIVLPTLGVTVSVLGVQGSTVRLGIDAPPGIKILRQELADREPAVAAAPARTSPAAHALCNDLNRVSLTLHLAQRQLEAGQSDAAQTSFARAIELLDQIDRDRIAALEAPALPPAIVKPNSNPKKCRTLIVEDDANERELLVGLLNLQGCECATAADGQDALEYLATHEKPDVVLLDMWMPRVDGPHTLELIRRDPKLSGVRVFSISGTAPRELGIPTGPEGIDGWFPKPLNPRKLWDAISGQIHSPGAN